MSTLKNLHKKRKKIMSQVIEFFCEDFEDVLDEDISMEKKQLFFGSDNLTALIYPGIYNEHYEDLNFFEYLEEEFSIHDILFSNIIDEELATISADQAVGYFEKIINLLNINNDLPLMFSFVEASSQEIFLETSYNNVDLIGGYNFCSAISKNTNADLRAKDAFNIGDKDYLIKTETIKEYFEDEFLAMYEVAKNAHRLSKNLILQII